MPPWGSATIRPRHRPPPDTFPDRQLLLRPPDLPQASIRSLKHNKTTFWLKRNKSKNSFDKKDKKLNNSSSIKQKLPNLLILATLLKGPDLVLPTAPITQNRPLITIKSRLKLFKDSASILLIQNRLHNLKTYRLILKISTPIIRKEIITFLVQKRWPVSLQH